MEGFLNIDKPQGITSFGVVSALRRALRQKRMGHAGTLDPDATGVLVVAVGPATRLLPYLPTEPKVYEFEIRFGTETDTLDNTGTVVEESAVTPTEEQLRGVLEQFTGDIAQVPPRFSAVKIDGERAYRKARKSESFDIEPKQIRIDSIEVLSYDTTARVARCRAVCSAGTYVRALVRDIAHAVGTVGHAAVICRTAVGSFRIDAAISPDTPAEDLRAALVSVADACTGVTQVTLDQDALLQLTFGRRITVVGLDQTGPVVAFTPEGRLASVLQTQPDGSLQPVRVFITTEDLVGQQP